MKIYQIIFFTLSTVSFILCSQQPNQNDDNNSAYHIEFEDKSANGGYGYKVQVSGKAKYQETWKNDKQNTQTESSAESLNYLKNTYAAPTGTENVQADDNNVADNYLSSSAAVSNSVTPSQYSSNPTIDTTKYHYTHQQPINDNPSSSSYQSQQITKNPYSSLNNYHSYSPQIYKPSSQSSFSPQIQDSTGQDWQVSSKSTFVPSVPLPTKSSLQIMDYNHYGTSTGPQIIVESTSGKLNQFTNQVDTKPQITLPSEADLSSQYLQNSNILHQNSGKTASTSSYINSPISVEYYQPSSQFQGTNRYKTAYTTQYASQLPSISLTHSSSNQGPQLSTYANNYYVKNSELYTPPVAQHANDVILPGISFAQNPSSSKVQYYTPSVSKPTTHLSEQKIEHSKGNVVHKTKATTIKYAPQYQSEQVAYSVPTQNQVQNLAYNAYEQYIPVGHSFQIPSSPNVDYSQGAIQSQNVLYKPTTLATNYPNELSQLSASQLGSQDVKYVINQNSHPFQNPSTNLAADYNQFIQQYPTQNVQLSSVVTPVSQNTYQQSSPGLKSSPQFSIDYNQLLQQVSNQHPSVPVPTAKPAPKNIQYQNLYSVQQPTAGYQYRQELPYSKIQSTSQNSVQSSHSLPLNSINHGDLTNSYSNLLGGYGQQATVSNGIPISPYGISEKDTSQLLYAPGMIYGQGANGQTLLNLNAYSTIGNHGSPGTLQVKNPYTIMRRSSGKQQNNKNVVDQKQTA